MHTKLWSQLTCLFLFHFSFSPSILLLFFCCCCCLFLFLTSHWKLIFEVTHLSSMKSNWDSRNKSGDSISCEYVAGDAMKWKGEVKNINYLFNWYYVPAVLRFPFHFILYIRLLFFFFCTLSLFTYISCIPYIPTWCRLFARVCVWRCMSIILYAIS